MYIANTSEKEFAIWLQVDVYSSSSPTVSSLTEREPG